MQGYAVFAEKYPGRYITLRPPFDSFAGALAVIRGNYAYDRYHVQGVGGAQIPSSYQNSWWNNSHTVLDGDLEVLED